VEQRLAPRPHRRRPEPDTLAYWPAAHPSTGPDIRAALQRHAHHQAATEHPDDATRVEHARQARERSETAANAYYEARSELQRRSHQPLYDTGAAETIPDLTQRVAAAQQRVEQADQRAEGLYRDPAITSHADPTTLLATAQTAWLEDTTPPPDSPPRAPTSRSTRSTTSPTSTQSPSTTAASAAEHQHRPTPAPRRRTY
jgi:hypothetical protein